VNARGDGVIGLVDPAPRRPLSNTIALFELAHQWGRVN
jgi:hypothetical protein